MKAISTVLLAIVLLVGTFNSGKCVWFGAC